MSLGMPIFYILLFYLIFFLFGRMVLLRRERALGYPKNDESIEDVKYLISKGEKILAIRCYRRIFKVDLKTASSKVKEFDI